MARSVRLDASVFNESFPQIDNAVASTSGCNDMVDSGVQSQQRSMFKDRNISITEDEEAISLGDERYRYKSVSEEDEECEKVVEVEKKAEKPKPVEVKKEEQVIKTQN